MRFAWFFALLATPVLADTPLSGAQFDAYARGKTLYYGKGNQIYGAEQYLPDRRVIWTFLDGSCQHGHWYEQAEQICFVYEGAADGPQCWHFFTRDGGLVAHFEGDPDATSLSELDQIAEPLICLGPQPGV